MGIRDRLIHGWDAFKNKGNEEVPEASVPSSNLFGSSTTPGFISRRIANDKNLLSAIYMRIAIDVTQAYLRHIRVDDKGRYKERMKSGLDDCLNVEANLDQAGSQFRFDLAMTAFDKGHAVVVPIRTDINPLLSGGYDIKDLRVGHIVQWFPEHVKVSVYNEKKGKRENLVLHKRTVAIIENPFYLVMNETNSILQRVSRKLQILDAIDEAAGSGKLDIIIQLPYTIKSDLKREQAESRRAAIETQLKGSKYGIAYADASERITQLNRPAENNMLKQIEYLMGQLYAQLGLDETVFNGTANEATLLNYRNRTLEPILRAFTEALTRTFLSKTARTQGQKIDFHLDVFKLLPLSALADIADKLSRNEIVTANEMRGVIGFDPVDDEKADKLINSNMPQPEETTDPILE